MVISNITIALNSVCFNKSVAVHDSDSKLTPEILSKLSSKFSEISPQNMVILSLGITPNQTKDEIITMIEQWGFPIREWFVKTSHFKQRLLKTGIIIVVSTDRYSLSTIKGSTLFKKMIEKYSD